MTTTEYNLKHFQDFLQPQTYRVFRQIYLMMEELTLMNEKKQAVDIFKLGLESAQQAVSLSIDLLNQVAPNADPYAETDGTIYFKSCIHEAEELQLKPDIWQAYAELACVNKYLIEFDQEFTFKNNHEDHEIYDALDDILAMCTKAMGYLKLDSLKNIEAI